MVPWERVKRIITGTAGGSPPEDSTSDRAANLYRCAACETVYISAEMESCPDCSASVVDVPNERQLGLNQ